MQGLGANFKLIVPVSPRVHRTHPLTRSLTPQGFVSLTSWWNERMSGQLDSSLTHPINHSLVSGVFPSSSTSSGFVSRSFSQKSGGRPNRSSTRSPARLNEPERRSFKRVELQDEPEPARSEGWLACCRERTWYVPPKPA